MNLIANTGIQFLTKRLMIDSDASTRMLFYEWFDDEKTIEWDLEFAYQLRPSNKVVHLADLESSRFVDSQGNLLVQEDQVLANPNVMQRMIHDGNVQPWPNGLFYTRWGDRNCKVECYFNQWIPIPYFEVNSENGEFRQGPYNWCRCKIIPDKEQPQEGNLIATILIAFDTRSLYHHEANHPECPVFENELQKTYRFCNSTSMLLDFCSGENEWLRKNLMEIVHGVRSLQNIPFVANRGQHRYDFLASYLWLLEYMADNVDLPEVTLMRDRDRENIPVEMIIDIGNSQTAAILFEKQSFTEVEPLTLQNFTDPIKPDGTLNRTQKSFDMRVAFQKTDFGLKSAVNSKQFIWPSLVRLGDEAQKLTHQTVSLEQGDEVFSTYSSPKRYLWDDKAMKEEWRCVKITNDGKNELPKIEGISNYFQDNGCVDEDGLGYGYHYSRKTLMTFAFMEIIAQANAQINSYEYREFRGNTNKARYINKVVMTCPTGMSKAEQRSLHKCLEDALFVLEMFYKNNDSTYTPYHVRIVPDLNLAANGLPQWMFDEATCSQFVYLYGALTETFQNYTKEFFRLYGKQRNNHDSLIIGSLDIGAGTSDIAVCQYDYNENNPSRLRPIPLFWDSFDTAGDDMLRVLISNILLQGQDGILEQELVGKRGWDEDRARRVLHRFFGANSPEQSFKDRILRRDFTLQVLVPMMSKYLQLLSDGEVYREIDYDDFFAELEPSEEVRMKFSDMFGFELKEIRWKYDSGILSKHIKGSMDDLLQKVATILYSYDCDIILLSGRPTSLPPIKETFLKYMPTPDKLVIMNKHRIGRWFPFADEFGYLNNSKSKSIVPTGAMIGYLASNIGGYHDFSLDLSKLGERLKPTTDYFVINDRMVQTNTCFITPTQRKGSITVNTFPQYIGAKQFDLSLYPIRPFYVLDVNDEKIIGKIKTEHSNENLTDKDVQNYLEQYREQLLRHCPLTFTIERPDFQNAKEVLIIESVEGVDREILSPDDFSLSIQSQNDPDCYWLDSGSFDINIIG
mgnify:CR=1 FL=1